MVGEQFFHLLLVERYLCGVGVGFLLRGILVQVAQFLEPAVGVAAHRTEFQEVEDPVVAPHALRFVDHRPRAVESDGNGHDEQQRREYDDRPERRHDVERAFPERHAEHLHLPALFGRRLVRERVIGDELHRAEEILRGDVARHGAVDPGAQVTAALCVLERCRGDQDDSRSGKP